MLAEMKRRLERVERLKAHMVRHSAPWPLMFWNMCPLPNERIESLTANERVVNDWYRDIRGIVWTRERVTADPDDQGRKCEPDGYLADVLQRSIGTASTGRREAAELAPAHHWPDHRNGHQRFAPDL